MDTIWKFELEIIDEQMVEMPEGAIILAVQAQYDKPWLWARVNPHAKPTQRKIMTHGTGHEVPETTGSHLGTYQIQGGRYVFHVFESACN